MYSFVYLYHLLADGFNFIFQFNHATASPFVLFFTEATKGKDRFRTTEIIKISELKLVNW